MNKYLFVQAVILIGVMITMGIVSYMQYVIEELVKENEELRKGVR